MNLPNEKGFFFIFILHIGRIYMVKIVITCICFKNQRSVIIKQYYHVSIVRQIIYKH